MAGLLGEGWDDPQSQMMLGLAQGLLSARGGAGLAAGIGGMQAAQQNGMKNKLIGAQLDNYRSEIEARKLAGIKDARQQSLIESMFPAPGAGAGSMSPGAFAPAVDGMGPTIPPQMQQPKASGLASMTPDMVARLKLGGLDLTDIYKFSQEPQKYEAGSIYKDRNTGGERYIPKVGEGIAADKFGFYSALPGYGAAQANIEGAKTGAVEGAKAGFDLVRVVGPDGAERYIPRSTVLGGQPTAPTPKPMPPRGGSMASSPGESDRFAILSQELRKAQASGNAADIASLQREIGRLPASERTGASPSGLDVPGFQASPTATQAAAAKAGEARAVDTAKADVVRDTGQQKEGKLYGQLTAGLDRAISLLAQGPTASGAGALADSAAGFFGKSTKGADTASQLDTISGWLSSNVPRMEGPQSDKDVQQYRIMAAEVGDRTKPVSQRLAAARELQGLQAKYAQLNGGTANSGAGGEWGDKPKSATAASALPANPSAQTLIKGQSYTLPNGAEAVWDGMKFKGK